MDDYSSEPQGPREQFLGILLSVLVMSGFLFLLVVICGGLSIYIGMVVVGLAGIGLVHYLLWGHALSEEVAEEREQEEIRARSGVDDWESGEPRGPQGRF